MVVNIQVVNVKRKISQEEGKRVFICKSQPKNQDPRSPGGGDTPGGKCPGGKYPGNESPMGKCPGGMSRGKWPGGNVVVMINNVGRAEGESNIVDHNDNISNVDEI